MTNEAAAILALSGTVAIAAWWHWNERVRRVPLAEFGQAEVERVLKWEPDPVRLAILERGWMTSHEWTSMNQRQCEAVAVELKRRISKPEDVR